MNLIRRILTTLRRLELFLARWDRAEHEQARMADAARHEAKVRNGRGA